MRRPQHPAGNPHAPRRAWWTALLVAWALCVQPAFALRLSCAAVGQLWPAQCCCQAEVSEAPSCCAPGLETGGESAPAPHGPQLAAERPDCNCALELDAPAPAVPAAPELQAGTPLAVHAWMPLACEPLAALARARAASSGPPRARAPASTGPRGARGRLFQLQQQRC